MKVSIFSFEFEYINIFIYLFILLVFVDNWIAVMRVKASPILFWINGFDWRLGAYCIGFFTNQKILFII